MCIKSQILKEILKFVKPVMHFHFCQKYECLGAKNVVLHRRGSRIQKGSFVQEFRLENRSYLDVHERPNGVTMPFVDIRRGQSVHRGGLTCTGKRALIRMRNKHLDSHS